MTTLKEKAREYADKNYPKTKANDDWVDDGYDEGYNDAANPTAHKAYIAGYTEAQRWRDVNVELPKINKRVLIKTNTGLTYVGYWDGRNFNESFGCKPIIIVVAYRPIETI